MQTTEPDAPPFTLIDIGANLGHDSFAPDLPAVIDRAAAAGVTRMVVTGASLAGTAAAIELSRRWPRRLRCTAGVHPHHATELDDAAAIERLRELIQAPEVVAGGECGLDYFRNYSPQALQMSAFEKQLELCAQYQRPVFLHQRDAHTDFMSILDRYLSRLPKVVVHCFTGTGEELQDYLDRDLHVGITGWICDERRGQHLRELVSRIPLNRLMIETDAPYLLPRDLTPKPASRRNEPAFLPHVLRTVAACRGEDPAFTAAGTTAVAAAFFGWR